MLDASLIHKEQVLATLRLVFNDKDTRAPVTGYIEREILAEAEKSRRGTPPHHRKRV